MTALRGVQSLWKKIASYSPEIMVIAQIKSIFYVVIFRSSWLTYGGLAPNILIYCLQMKQIGKYC